MSDSKVLMFPRFAQEIVKARYFGELFRTGLLLSLTTNLIALSYVWFISTRGPSIVTLAPDATLYTRVSDPSPEMLIAAAANAYCNFRNNWSESDVSNRLNQANSFIPIRIHELFLGSRNDTIKFSQEKHVSQKV